MSENSKLYKNSKDTALVLDTKSDIEGATKVAIAVMRPGEDTPVEWVGAVFETTKIRYYTKAGDLPVVGTYRMQSIVETASGAWRGETIKPYVHDYFD